ncbi:MULTISPECIES: MarR family winged helix-turn-helix transcriptional regulator [Streptomyces]|uniref:MarR family transcriptional regulator n=1 Tax=Streptomyces siderophoricus TaxID=2802281 RepID=A0ABS1MY09_9ACTN|nr:MarR family winged helix-turn-helix transcriptional regulator [Streptomyces sp. 9-7]MBL1092639.1 MarR family transcriptional regulator [Streptomyces sp. 9-7]
MSVIKKDRRDADADADSDSDVNANANTANADFGRATPTEELLYGVIRRLWPLHRTVVRAVERELTGTGLTAGEHALLDALRTDGPRTVPQLARTMGLDRQPVQRWVNHAAELGLVVTAPNPAHRRSPLIELTTEGTHVIRGIQDFEATELRHRLADLPAADVRTALHVLDRIGEEFHHLASAASTATTASDTHRTSARRDSPGIRETGDIKDDPDTLGGRGAPRKGRS